MLTRPVFRTHNTSMTLCPSPNEFFGKPAEDLSTSERIYWTVLFFIGFFIPVLLTLCSYTGLLYYVRQIKDALDKQGNSKGSTVLHDQRSDPEQFSFDIS